MKNHAMQKWGVAGCPHHEHGTDIGLGYGVNPILCEWWGASLSMCRLLDTQKKRQWALASSSVSQ